MELAHGDRCISVVASSHDASLGVRAREKYMKLHCKPIPHFESSKTQMRDVMIQRSIRIDIVYVLYNMASCTVSRTE
jgi:hypothetical protein